MAEGVTYADLRFAKSPPEKSRPPGDAPHEDCSDGEGELTYENFPAAPRPRQPAAPGPAPQPPGALFGRRAWSLVPLALLGACLFLLATCLGLGLRYWQVSRALEGASQRHRAESSTLAERLGGREENLTQTLRLLSRARAELSATRLALRQSQQDGNGTQQRLEGELERVANCLTSLQQEKEKGARELEAARSCQQMGCCPSGWTLFRWKCLWVSADHKNWEWSRWDCERQQAQLLVLKPWDAGTIWGATVISSLLQSDVFWIGLTGKSKWNRVDEWRWVDGAHYTGLLKQDPGPNIWWPQQPVPPPLMLNGEPHYEIVQILDSKLKRGRLFYLVRWKDFGPRDNEWLAAEHVNAPALLCAFHKLYPLKPGGAECQLMLPSPAREVG